MVRVAEFQRVSREVAGFETEDVKLPVRATSGSAEYDFFSPIGFTLKPGEEVVVKTGVRCKMEEGWVLSIYPRSGFGFKYGVGLANTVGIIDSDYYNSENEGHIMIKLVNRGSKVLEVSAGMAFCQGIFTPFGITVDDCVESSRNGGFGSTGM